MLTEADVLKELMEGAEASGLVCESGMGRIRFGFSITGKNKKVIGLVKKSRRKIKDKMWVDVGAPGFLEQALSADSAFIVVVDQINDRYVTIPLGLVALTRGHDKQHPSFNISVRHGRYYLVTPRGEEEISLDKLMNTVSPIFDIWAE